MLRVEVKCLFYWLKTHAKLHANKTAVYIIQSWVRESKVMIWEGTAYVINVFQASHKHIFICFCLPHTNTAYCKRVIAIARSFRNKKERRRDLCYYVRDNFQWIHFRIKFYDHTSHVGKLSESFSSVLCWRNMEELEEREELMESF